jgi:hypothetical protein
MVALRMARVGLLRDKVVAIGVDLALDEKCAPILWRCLAGFAHLSIQHALRRISLNNQMWKRGVISCGIQNPPLGGELDSIHWAVQLQSHEAKSCCDNCYLEWSE